MFAVTFASLVAPYTYNAGGERVKKKVYLCLHTHTYIHKVYIYIYIYIGTPGKVIRGRHT